jgi:hypothetical protein
VIGMLVANVERHLVPAQVVRIEEKNGSSEETRYYLPFGKAIDASDIASFLNAASVSFELDSETA